METSYLWAWAVVGLSALALVAAIWRLFRSWDAPLLKMLGCWWLLLVLVVPAQVPGHTEYLAPAFIVFIFEAVFQASGSPGAAGRILLATSVVALIAAGASYLIARSRRRTSGPG